MKFTPEVQAALETLYQNAENDFERHRLDALVRDLTAPPVVEIIDDKHQKFDGIIYTKKHTGHYATNNLSIHRAIYSYYNGEIPEGYHIHHVDLNKDNNSIENLLPLTPAQHVTLHNSPKSPLEKTTFTCSYCGKTYEAFDIGRNKFCSQKCREHYYNRAPTVTKICQCCGAQFQTSHAQVKKYCSEKCRRSAQKSRYEEKRTCAFCGKEFTAYRHAKTRYCSRHCFMKDRRAHEK